MSWTDKELSEMAKAAQAEQKFAYQDSFWSEMEAMLPAKKKKAFPFFWLALVPVVAALGYLALSPFTKGETKVMHAAKTLDRETIMFSSLNENVASISNTSSFKNEQQARLNNTANVTSAAPVIANEVETTEMERQPQAPTPVTSAPILSANELAETPEILLEVEPKRIPEFNFPVEEMEVAVLELEEPAELEAPVIGKSTPRSFLNSPISTLPKLKLTEIENKQTFALEPLFAHTRKNFWNGYVEAGFSMGQSYMASQVGHTSAFNLGLGARYDFNNYFVQFGAGGELQNVKYELSEREKIYHTSSTVLQNNYSYKQLYRVETPFTFGYQFPKHLVQISVIPSYLAGAKMRYEYLENGTSMRNETMYETEPGNKIAWNDFSTSFGLGYGYRLTKTIALGANLKWQLMNQLNSIAATEGNVRPLSGQVFIRKTLK